MKWFLGFLVIVAVLVGPSSLAFGAGMASRWTTTDTAIVVAGMVGTAAACGSPLGLLAVVLLMTRRDRRGGSATVVEGRALPAQDWTAPPPTVSNPWSTPALPSGAMASTTFVNRMRFERSPD